MEPILINSDENAPTSNSEPPSSNLDSDPEVGTDELFLSDKKMFKKRSLSPWPKPLKPRKPHKAVVSSQNHKLSNILKIIPKNGNFSTVSPFVIHNLLTSTLGKLKSCVKLKSGALTIEVTTEEQWVEAVSITKLGDFEVEVDTTAEINCCEGIVVCKDLMNCSVQEITDELCKQGVSKVQQICKRHKGEFVPTAAYVLTFCLPKLPSSINVAFYRLRVRPFIPDPWQCFKCFKYSHTLSQVEESLNICSCGSPVIKKELTPPVKTSSPSDCFEPQKETDDEPLPSEIDDLAENFSEMNTHSVSSPSIISGERIEAVDSCSETDSSLTKLKLPLKDLSSPRESCSSLGEVPEYQKETPEDQAEYPNGIDFLPENFSVSATPSHFSGERVETVDSSSQTDGPNSHTIPIEDELQTSIKGSLHSSAHSLKKRKKKSLHERGRRSLRKKDPASKPSSSLKIPSFQTSLKAGSDTLDQFLKKMKERRVLRKKFELHL